jgi:hypothetical protein
MQDSNPEIMARAVIDACADCNICRFLMEDTPCQVFPELYRLYDKENEKNEPITAEELKNPMDLCNYCALCACHNIRSDIMRAKHAFVSRGRAQTNHSPPGRCRARGEAVWCLSPIDQHSFSKPS